MKKVFTSLVLAAGLLCTKGSYAGSALWQQVNLQSAPSEQIMVFHPDHYQVYTFNEQWVKMQMFGLTTNPEEGMILELPMPNGTFRSFKVWEDPMMYPAMAAKYADIKTFTGVAVGDQRVTAKLDFTVYGFHAMIFDGENTSFVDPYDLLHDGYYMVHYKRDENRPLEKRMKCEFKSAHEDELTGESMAIDMGGSGLPKLAARTGNGWVLKTYDLALSANHFYCQAATGLATPTMVQCLSAMTTSMNRVNGVYEREFSVHMNFCANEDTLIWPTNTGSINGTDPFGTAAINSNGGTCLTVNQTTCTNRIGTANYDLGHVFTTGGGGISGLGIVCTSSQKAQSCTGLPSPVGDSYDIDYVAHEMGHEFGSDHTFANNTDGSCGGNAVASHAYEPGSGTTIMAYAGICSPDDLAMHSEAYFHASSLVQIYAKLIGSENVCATPTSTGNKLAFVPAFAATYSIPYKTPFELMGPTAVDSVADTATTYCWEQWNTGSASSSTTSRLVNTYTKGPLFRSYQPVYNPNRIFPKLSMLLAGTASDAGIEGNESHKLPDTARFLTFKMTVRAILAGKGTFNFPDDTIHLNAIQTAARTGFKVTSQGTTGITYVGGSTTTITWDVVGTDVAPVSAANVDIYMSTDGGNTWPNLVGTFPNTGSATVTVPNPATTSSVCRFKVKGSGNVFFNINLKHFTVSHSGAVVSSVGQLSALSTDTKVYPVPASDVLHISTGNHNQVNGVIYNAVGQAVWTGQINGDMEIPVASWARGVYHIRLLNSESSERVVKSIVIE